MTDTRTAPSDIVDVLAAPAQIVPEPASGLRSIINPATGAVIATVPEQGAADVDKAVDIARAAFESGPWPELTRTARARLLLRFADAIEANNASLFELETRNNGRPITETKAQLSRVPAWFRDNA